MNKNYRLKQVSAGLRGELWIRKDEHQQDFMCGPLQDQPTQQPFQEEQSLKPFLVPSYRLNKNGIVITLYSHQSTDIYQIYFYPHPFDAFRSHKWWINHHVQILMVFLEKNISGLAAIAQLFMVKLPSNIDRHVSWLNKHCSAVAVNFPIKTWTCSCHLLSRIGQLWMPSSPMRRLRSRSSLERRRCFRLVSRTVFFNQIDFKLYRAMI